MFKYNIETSRENLPTAFTETDGKKIYIHSKLFPSKEGDRFPDINTTENDLIIILGLGLGYHLKKAALSAAKKIAVIDIFPEIENDAIRANKFLTSDKFIFITGKTSAELPEILAQSINVTDYSSIKIAEHPASVRAFPEYYSQAKDTVSSFIQTGAGNKATIKAFANLYFRNALHCLSEARNYYPVKSLFNKFNGCPALVVSSAPSLDENIDYIIKHQNNFVIIAVDSALPPFLTYGVEPDIIVSIDPQPWISEHLFYSKGGKRSLLVHSITAKRPLVNIPVFLSLNSHPISQLIEEIYPKTIGDISTKTGTVAGDAVNLAYKMGCGPVYICGMDFSFPKYNIYARGTSYQNRFALYHSDRFHRTESFNADYIFKKSRNFKFNGINTRKSFLQYKEMTRQFIDNNRSIETIHICKEGLPLGIEVINNCEQIINNFNFDKQKILTKLSTDNQQIHNLISFNRVFKTLSSDNIFNNICAASEISSSKIDKYKYLINSADFS